jgi:hypothetical protein
MHKGVDQAGLLGNHVLVHLQPGGIRFNPDSSVLCECTSDVEFHANPELYCNAESASSSQ